MENVQKNTMNSDAFDEFNKFIALIVELYTISMDHWMRIFFETKCKHIIHMICLNKMNSFLGDFFKKAQRLLHTLQIKSDTKHYKKADHVEWSAEQRIKKTIRRALWTVKQKKYKRNCCLITTLFDDNIAKWERKKMPRKRKISEG